MLRISAGCTEDRSANIADPFTVWMTISRASARDPPRCTAASISAIAAGSLGALSILHASLWSAALMTDTLRPAQRDFWLDRGALQTVLLEQDPALKVMEFGDGMINFSFDFPVRHGFVFAGDAQSLESLRAGRLLRESYADGFRVLSSYEYLRVPDGAEDWDSDRIRAFLENSFLDDRIKDELRSFDFEMRLVHRPSGVPFIGLIPRG